VSTAATFGWERSSIVVTSANSLAMCFASDWAKMLRMIEATMSRPAFGTATRTLRSPLWASDITSFTPLGPPVLSERSRLVQKSSNGSSARRNNAKRAGKRYEAKRLGQSTTDYDWGRQSCTNTDW